MDEERRAIELETANLKLAREKLAFNREIDSKRRLDKAVQIGGTVASTTRAVGNGSWRIFKVLLTLVTGGILGMLALLAYAAANVAIGSNSSGNFEYRLGAFMGGLPNWVYPLVIIGGMIFWVNDVYGGE